MGKRERLKKQKIEQEKLEQKKALELNYDKKNPWIKFWKRLDFWIYALCLVAIIAFPFIKKDQFSNTGSGDLAVLHTSMGDIEIKLYDEDAPRTVDNFKKLTKQGFYKDMIWHRVIKTFMIQTGDPNGDGSGGPDYAFDDEINDHKIVKGTVAMANSGPNTNGSQFFIVTDEAQPHLDGVHTVFGEVVSGMDVVKAISEVPVDQNDKPIDSVLLNSVELK